MGFWCSQVGAYLTGNPSQWPSFSTSSPALAVPDCCPGSSGQLCHAACSWAKRPDQLSNQGACDIKWTKAPGVFWMLKWLLLWPVVCHVAWLLLQVKAHSFQICLSLRREMLLHPHVGRKVQTSLCAAFKLSPLSGYGLTSSPLWALAELILFEHQWPES